MERKEKIDAFGASLLIGFSALLALNQVLIKIVNDGLQPVFQAGMRSVCAFFIVFAIAKIRRKHLTVRDGSLVPGIICGLIFGAEFVFLFLALDYTTVSRTSVMFYSMPVWLTIAAHFLVPGDRLTTLKVIGLGAAIAGVSLALLDRADGDGSITGDLLAVLGAMGWAAIGIIARISKLNRSTPEMQLIYQLAISPIILLPAALFFGPFIRDLQLMHLGLFAFQVIGVVSIGFLVWFWVLSVYPPSDMASFGFLAPVFGVFLGWLILDEQMTTSIVLSLILVSTGIILINWRRPKPR
jgi:drug/metabolite transporter (DMT)-like permease